MTKQLIEGLRTAADWIESGKADYNWGRTGSCNCGILAQVINNINASDIEEEFIKGSTWTEVVCNTTKEPISKIIQTLLDIGMTAKDFINLEFLTYDGVEPENWWIRNEEPIYKNPIEVVAYMRNWADRLEKEQHN